MRTASPTKTESSVLFGKARRTILALLFTHADQAFYLRQIVRVTGLGIGPVQREAKALTEAGVIKRTARGKEVYFQADRLSPVFADLRNLIVKTSGVGDVLRAALAPVSTGINAAFIYGSFARGTERRASDIDLMIVGDVDFSQVVSAISSAQELLGREVNPTVYSTSEFRAKLAAGHRFVRSVMDGSKLFVIGDEDELTGLG